PVIVTRCSHQGLSLASRVRVTLEDGQPCCRLELEAQANAPAWLVLALRPYNPEGISFIHDLRMTADRCAWIVDGDTAVHFDQEPRRHLRSDYTDGGVGSRLPAGDEKEAGECDVGLVTAAALFPIRPGEPARLGARIH